MLQDHLSYIPDSTYLVYASDDEVARIRTLPFVDWVGLLPKSARVDSLAPMGSFRSPRRSMHVASSTRTIGNSTRKDSVSENIILVSFCRHRQEMDDEAFRDFLEHYLAENSCPFGLYNYRTVSRDTL